MKTTLIVEDVLETRRWLSTIVRNAFADCVIDEAPNVRRANQVIAAGDYDLALIDLGLPDGSGLDVLRNLRQASARNLCGDNSDGR